MKTLLSLILMTASLAIQGAAFDPVYRRVNATASGLQDIIISPPPANTFALRGQTNGLAFEVVVSDGLVAEDVSGQWYLRADLQALLDAQPGLVVTPSDLSDYALTSYVDSELSGKSDVSHTHSISDVSGLQTALDGKASTSHNHDGVYAPLSHTHTTNDLSQVNAHLANLLAQIQTLQASIRQEYSTNVTTASDGTYTWTFPSSFPSAPTILCSPVDNTSGIRYDWKVTSVSTSSATVLITRRQDQLISLLGLNIGVNASQAATAIHLHATR